MIKEEKEILLPKKLTIPEIDDERLRELYRFLRPIVTIDEIKYLLKEYTLEQLRNQSFIWNRNEDKREVVDQNKLETVEDFICLNKWGHYSMFKPTIAEVLSQVPVRTIREADAFEIIGEPETSKDLYKEAMEQGFHLSKVRSYKIHK